ncbi:hypothetical protein ACRALDRAFT_1069002 [Sodiomyces alcalophilus JCM 7366]|uniref:uncharacterized protein n=1 Tax=Sodiomyces alcalophilus JCM 7366 TaxID=591952 RepID=UPI0039B46C2F
MKDRLARPPPLALAPPKVQHTIVVRESFLTSAKGSGNPCYWAAYAESSQSKSQSCSDGRSPSKRHVWFSLASDVVHANLCAVLMAAMTTYLYQVPPTMASRTSHAAVAAVVFLSLDILLSILSLLLRHPQPGPSSHRSYGPALPGWALFVRLILAVGLVALFITWVSHSPTTRVFDPGYRLWGIAPHTGDEFVAGAVFVIAVWDFVMVILGQKDVGWDIGLDGDEKQVDEEIGQGNLEARGHPSTRFGTWSGRMLGGVFKAWWSQRTAGPARSASEPRSPPGSAISLGWFRLDA